MKRKTIVLSILGTTKDARGGKTDKRWNTWCPNIGLVSQPDFKINELHLVFDKQFCGLANGISTDIATATPGTKVIFEELPLNDPWDFEEVYGKFYELAKQPCFHDDKADYYIHISTGSHVEQICLFLLAESHHLPGKRPTAACFFSTKSANSHSKPKPCSSKPSKRRPSVPFRQPWTSTATSSSSAGQAKKLFAVSRKAKTSANDSDRLTKFLARFGLKFKEIVRA